MPLTSHRKAYNILAIPESVSTPSEYPSPEWQRQASKMIPGMPSFQTAHVGVSRLTTPSNNTIHRRAFGILHEQLTSGLNSEAFTIATSPSGFHTVKFYLAIDGTQVKPDLDIQAVDGAWYLTNPPLDLLPTADRLDNPDSDPFKTPWMHLQSFLVNESLFDPSNFDKHSSERRFHPDVKAKLQDLAPSYAPTGMVFFRLIAAPCQPTESSHPPRSSSVTLATVLTKDRSPKDIPVKVADRLVELCEGRACCVV